MTKTETLALPIGAKVYCTVHGAEGWTTITDIRKRDGYIKITGERVWCPPHNFAFQPRTSEVRPHYDPAREGERAAKAENAANRRNEMWLVLRPTPNSLLEDILVPCTWVSLGQMFKGGLDGTEVYGLYPYQETAKNVAISLLNVRDGKLDPSMIR